MAAADPWLRFGYTFRDCLKKISDPLMCVAPEFRDRGIGTKLIGFAEKIAFCRDKNLFIFVSAFNAGAIRLYKRLGYKKVGEIEDYNFRGVSEFIFRKTTGPRLQNKKIA